MAELWRLHKSRIKAEYYSKYETDEERLKHRPLTIPLEQFRVLLQYWGDGSVQSRAGKNTVNRSKVSDPHNVGRTSFAQLGKELVW